MICLDAVLAFLFGYSTRYGWKRDRELSQACYEKSAQVITVMGRGCYSIIQRIQLNNFWLWHDRYVHPEYALEHDHIRLYGVTPTHAFFSITNPEVDIHNTKVMKYSYVVDITFSLFNHNDKLFQNIPFVFAKKFLASKQLLIMPHSSLHRLADKIGDPAHHGKRLTFIDNTSRCGSTLLSAMLNAVPGVRVMSEPWTVKLVYSMYVMGQISKPEFEALVKSSVRLLCKEEKKWPAEHYVIKNWNTTAPFSECPLFQHVLCKLLKLLNFCSASNLP